MKKAIYGGSFDPVHAGHLQLVETVHAACDLDGVILMPCRLSPWKEGTEATPPQRVEMVRLAVQEKGWGWAEVSDWEVGREGRSYSWMTAEHFESVEPTVEWHWIVGADQWAGIEGWARADTLRRILRFIVAARGDVAIPARPGWRMVPVTFDHPASSTALRESFAEHLDWLSPAVRTYCREHRLYYRGTEWADNS